MLDDSKDKAMKSLNLTLKTGKKRKVRDTIKSVKGQPSLQGNHVTHSRVRNK